MHAKDIASSESRIADEKKQKEAGNMRKTVRTQAESELALESRPGPQESFILAKNKVLISFENSSQTLLTRLGTFPVATQGASGYLQPLVT